MNPSRTEADADRGPGGAATDRAPAPTDLIDRAFLIGVLLKGVDGALELAGGMLLLTVAHPAIERLVAALTRSELAEDPHDWVATHLVRLADGLTVSTTRFAAAYLLAHGLVKVVLVAAVLRERRWAYPWMIAVLVAFIGYQLYRIALAPTIGMELLTAFDAALAWLTWREYRRRWPPRSGRTAGARSSTSADAAAPDCHSG